jgi:hypothetical protein
MLRSWDWGFRHPVCVVGQLYESTQLRLFAAYMGDNVDLEPFGRGQDFIGGAIDGAWVPEPWATRLVNEGGGKILVDTEPGVKRMLYRLWFRDGVGHPLTLTGFKPLKMTDTAFQVPPEKQGRIAQPQPDPKTGTSIELIDVTQPATFFAGGHGLVTTASDYLRFAQMLGNGGELEGARILGPRTVAYMASDHVRAAGISKGINWIPGAGYGFGLGFGVRKEPGASDWPGSVGDFFWAGYAGTYFWIDPARDLSFVFRGSVEVAPLRQ